MISGLSTFSILFLGFLFFLFCGSSGFLFGWFVRGWRNTKLATDRENALVSARSEVSKTNHLLAKKTQDLHILQASSRSLIDELKAELSRNIEEQKNRDDQAESRQTKNSTSSSSSDEMSRKAIVPDQSLIEKLVDANKSGGNAQQPVSDEQQRRNRIRRQDDQKASDYAEMLVNAERERRKKQITKGESLDEAGSSDEFFETDFTGQSIDPLVSGQPDPDKTRESIRQNQLRVIAKLLERNRKLDIEISRLRSTQPSSPAHNNILTGSQQETIKKLNRKLQESDKLNSELQARAAEVPDLQARLDKLESNREKYDSMKDELKSVNQRFHTSEEQGLALQSNNGELHAQITQLRKELDEKAKVADQQLAARHLFEGNANESAAALKKEIDRAGELEKSVSELESRLGNQHEINRKLVQQSNERQQFADQLDTLNLQLESGLERQKSIVQQHVEKEAELKDVNQRLQQSVKQSESAKNALIEELSESREQLNQKTTGMAALDHKLSGYIKLSEKQKISIENLKGSVSKRDETVQAATAAFEVRRKKHAECKVALDRQVSINVGLGKQVKSLKREAVHSLSILSENRALQEKVELKQEKISSLEQELEDSKRQSSEARAVTIDAPVSGSSAGPGESDLEDTKGKRNSSASSVRKRKKSGTASKPANKRDRSEERNKSAKNNTRKKKKTTSVKSSVAPEAAPRTSNKPGNQARKSVKKSAAAQSPDDLKLIHGIGPKLERLLHKQNITTFRQIAELDKSAVRKLAESLGSFGNRIERDNWVRSAKKLVRTQVSKAA